MPINNSSWKHYIEISNQTRVVTPNAIKCQTLFSHYRSYGAELKCPDSSHCFLLFFLITIIIIVKKKKVILILSKSYCDFFYMISNSHHLKRLFFYLLSLSTDKQNLKYSINNYIFKWFDFILGQIMNILKDFNNQYIVPFFSCQQGLSRFLLLHHKRYHF